MPYYPPPFIALGIACSAPATDITTGTKKANVPMPFNMTVNEVMIGVRSDQKPTGSTIITDVNENGTTIFSTNPTIDAGESTSVTAAVPPVISDPILTKGNDISVDIDQIGATIPGQELVTWLLGWGRW